MKNDCFCQKSSVKNRFVSITLIWLLLGITSLCQAQVYYTLTDGTATTMTDQLRRINLDGTGDALIKDNFIQTAGAVVLDAANNRLLVADVRISQPSTSLTNTKILAVSLASGNAVSTLITPAYISGAASMVIRGMALDRVNNYLYYTLDNGTATTMTDQVRRVNLDGTNDVLIKDNFIQAAGNLVLDVANNRLLLADARLSQPSTSQTNTRIVAVSLASGNAVSTLITPAYISGAASMVVGGLVIDRANNYLYYTLDDGTATTMTDQLRRINLDGTGDVLIKDNFIQSVSNLTGQAPGSLVLDAANNRLLVADVRLSQPSTSQTNTKIVVVSLASGNAVSTLLTPAYISGAASMVIGGLTTNNQDPPTVTTASVTAFGSNTATLGGNVTADGGVSVTERGVVYSSTVLTPTIATGTKAQIGSGTGAFSQTVSGLTASITYNVRAYAINGAGTSYGAVQTVVTPAPNNAPTVANAIPPRSATIGQNFTYTIPANTFTDPETPGSLNLTVAGLPGGLTFMAPATINGTPSTTVGSPFSVTVTATDPGSLSVSTTFSLSVNASAPMPVRLVRFSAQQLASGEVGLDWETSWEQNTAWFDVQRSWNALEFGSLGRVQATGESIRTQRYTFVDEATPAQTVYYRLRTVDKDGSFAYSSIVSVAVDKPVLLITILGNPARGSIQALINSLLAQSLQITVLNAGGQEVYRQMARVGQGQTNIEVDKVNLTVGLYQFVVSDGVNRHVKRILVD